MSVLIQSEMSTEPVSISSDLSISDVQEIMRSWGMRHLPVVEKEKLVGLVSERDILKAAALQKNAKSPVSEIMSRNPYSVNQDQTVSTVASVMAEKKYGCAVVVDNHGKVVGIFTTVDALRLLARLSAEPKHVDIRLLQLRDYLAKQKPTG